MYVLVNGERIEQADIDREADGLRDQYNEYVRSQSAEEGSEAQLREWCKDNLIERVLLRQEAVKSITDVPSSEIDEFYKKNKDNLGDMDSKEAKNLIERDLKVDRLVKNISSNAKHPDAQDIEKFYNDNNGLFMRGDQIRVSHIIKHIDDANDKDSAYVEILNVKEQLNQGVPFEDLAATNSDCPENAGDLGYFGRGQMVQSFEDVVFGMNVGDVSDVFKTEFGYHIAKLVDKIDGGPVPLKDVSESIEKRLFDDNKSTALDMFVDNLRDKADITTLADK